MKYNKTFILSTFLSLLIVGCSNASSNLPSSSSTSSSSSQSSSSSSTTSSSSSSSSSSSTTSSSSSSSSSSSTTSSSSSSSSSSSTTSSSGSGSTSEPPVTNTKIPFNQIGSLVAQVVDAKALGVSNSKDNVSTPRGRRQAQDDAVDSSEQNKMVKVTETYNPTTKVAEDKTIEVTFIRTTNTQTTELQTGMDTYVATAEDITIERLTDEPGRVVVKNVPNYEFRALNGDTPLQEGWISSDQETIEFLFTKLESGTFSKVATAPDLDINALIQPDSPAGQIILTNNPDYEYRLMNGEIELIPWTKYETETITFEFDASITPTIEARGIDASITFESIQGLTYDITLNGNPVVSDVTDNGSMDEDATEDIITLSGLTEGLSYDISFEGQVLDNALTNITIESRSTDASISFTAFEGFKYAVKSGENTFISNVVDNDTNDINEKEGVITIKGLTQGLPYDVHYEGYVVLETITQDEVDGQVDKLYVLYQYTFISFVPLNLNERPKDKDLNLDYDDVPLYDKEGYFSNTTRQSFVVDNDTGLIYKIENINIASLSGGCVSVKDSPFPFDIKINLSDELEFFSIYQNSSITNVGCFKDKFGNKYINNTKLNYYDSITKTQFYVFGTNDQFDKRINYLETRQGITLKIDISGLDYQFKASTSVINAKLIFKDYERDLSNKDNYEILYTSGSVYFSDLMQGKMIISTFNSNTISFTNAFGIILFDGESNKVNIVDLAWYWDSLDMNSVFYSTYFLRRYDIFLKIYNGRVIIYEDFISFLVYIFNEPRNNNSGSSYIRVSKFDNYDWPGKKILLEDTGFENGSLVKYGINGNTSYDLIPQNINGKWSLSAYISGTYIAPPPTTFTLQPINR